MRTRILATLATALVLVSALPAHAATVGIPGPFRGSAVTSRGAEATGQKPESKLFYTQDDVWWAALGLAKDVTPGVYLFRLDPTGWTSVLMLPGSDPWSKADTSYDAATGQLLVSLRDNKPSTDANPRQSVLYRLTYDAGTGTWTVGTTTTITTANVETITVAKDTVGRIWVAFEQANAIKAGYLAVGATAFKFLRVSDTGVTSDDIAAVVAYGPGKIGVFWSDQASHRFLFATRTDTSATTRLSFTREEAFGPATGCPTTTSTACADDHVNIAAVGDTLYAVVKTSLNDASNADPNDPLIVLLKRTSSGWTPFEVSDVAANFTRPIVVVDPGADQVHVLANVLGGDTYLWNASASAPVFGSPVPWTTDDTYTLSNPTSTKQTVSSTTKLVAMTSTPGAPHRYWYNVA
jgi:hypothetical protein